MRIYLAGKVSRDNDWREPILGGRPGGLDTLEWLEEWPLVERAIFEEHDYVGPFFMSCDHGCAHGPATHGASGDATCTNEMDYPGSTNGGRRPLVAAKCQLAIVHSDLVFAWLDDPSAFGTLVEIGFAAGFGTCVAVAQQAGRENGELWLASQFANVRVSADSPVDALKAVLAHPTVVQVHRERARSATYTVLSARCESPIERRMLTALLDNYPLLMSDETDAAHVGATIEPTLFGQLNVLAGGRTYRTDFAILSKDVRLVIECDGHNYHERSPEQAQYDRARDRSMQLDGWTVFRFTGREITRDANRCAKEVVAILTRASVPQ